MNKTIIATFVASTLSINAFAQKVDAVAANQATQQIITEQMQAIDASVLAKLNAQNEQVVELNGVTYEQDENGVWSAIGAGALGLTAALFSGSTGGGNSSDEPLYPTVDRPDRDSDWGFEQGPIAPELDGNPLPDLDKPGKDGAYQIEMVDNQAIVTVDGEKVATLDGTPFGLIGESDNGKFTARVIGEQDGIVTFKVKGQKGDYIVDINRDNGVITNVGKIDGNGWNGVKQGINDAIAGIDGSIDNGQTPDRDFEQGPIAPEVDGNPLPDLDKPGKDGVYQIEMVDNQAIVTVDGEKVATLDGTPFGLIGESDNGKFTARVIGEQDGIVTFKVKGQKGDYIVDINRDNGVITNVGKIDGNGWIGVKQGINDAIAGIDGSIDNGQTPDRDFEQGPIAPEVDGNPLPDLDKPGKDGVYQIEMVDNQAIVTVDGEKVATLDGTPFGLIGESDNGKFTARVIGEQDGIVTFKVKGQKGDYIVDINRDNGVITNVGKIDGNGWNGVKQGINDAIAGIDGSIDNGQTPDRDFEQGPIAPEVDNKPIAPEVDNKPIAPEVDNGPIEDAPKDIELDRLTIIKDGSGVVVDGERYYATPEGLQTANGKTLATFDTLNKEVINTDGEVIGTWTKVGVGYHVELANGMKVLTDGAGKSIILDTNADKIRDNLRVDTIKEDGITATAVTKVSDDYTHSAVNAVIIDDNGDFQQKSGVVIVDRNTGDIHAGKVGEGTNLVGNINDIKPTKLQSIKAKVKARFAK